MSSTNISVVIVHDESGRWSEQSVDTDNPDGAYAHRCLEAAHVTVVGTVPDTDDTRTHVLADLKRLELGEHAPVPLAKLPKTLRFIDATEMVPPLLFTKIQYVDDAPVPVNFTGAEYAALMNG